VYAGVVRLRVILIVLALVVVPAVVFAVAKTTAAPARPAGWTAYPQPGATVSSSTAYSTVGTEDKAAEKFAIKADVVKWKRHHPGGACRITPPSSAQCTTAGGLPADLVALVATAIAPSTNP
jgi:hypothetical protein